MQLACVHTISLNKTSIGFVTISDFTLGPELWEACNMYLKYTQCRQEGRPISFLRVVSESHTYDQTSALAIRASNISKQHLCKISEQ